MLNKPLLIFGLPIVFAHKDNYICNLIKKQFLKINTYDTDKINFRYPWNDWRETG